MIQINGVSKQFNGTKALDNFTLEVASGELFGLVGPNGAGKTTLMRIISTLLVPDNGSIHVSGVDIAENPRAAKRLIGYLPDQAGVYQDMTVREFLEFFADAFLLKGAAHRAAVERAMQFSGLTARSDSTVEELSLGMKQRLLLAKTLLHGPKVLLLDEPATGLDPMARIDLREQLKALQAEGVTILISSHILSDLEDICTRIALIAAGRNANDGEGHSVIQLRAVQEPALLYEVDFLENGVAPADVLGTLAGVRVVRSAETQLLVEISGGAEQAARVLRALISAGLDITRFNSHPVGLEERYRVAFEGRHR